MVHKITVPSKHAAIVIPFRKADHFVGGAPAVNLVGIRKDNDQTYLWKSITHIKHRRTCKRVKALCATRIEGSNAIYCDELSDDLAQGRAEVRSLILRDMPMACEATGVLRRASHLSITHLLLIP